MILYSIENVKNNKFYLVKTNNFRTSKARIKYKLINKQFTSYYLQDEWNRFGSSNFVFNLLLTGDKEEVVTEYNKLKQLESCYNSRNRNNHPWVKYPVVKDIVPKTELISDCDGDLLALKYCHNCELHKLEDSFISSSLYCRECREEIEVEENEVEDILSW